MSGSHAMAVGGIESAPAHAGAHSQVESMFDRCGVGIYRYVAVRVGNDLELADDIMQQLWLQATRSKRLIPEDEFEYWLRAIAKNLIASHWRKIHRRPQHLPLYRPEVAAELAQNIDRSLLPSEIVDRRETREQLLLAITLLRSEDQELIVRHYVEGQPFQDIAQDMNCSARAIEGRLYRARRQLKEALDHLGEDD